MKPRRPLEEASFAITRWVGSTQSILVHTLFFACSFVLAYAHIVSFDRMLLVLTTVVSLEAIYLAIFIQMSLNVANEAIEEVEQDIDEIQQDVDEIQHDVDEIQEDVDEMQGDLLTGLKDDVDKKQRQND